MLKVFVIDPSRRQRITVESLIKQDDVRCGQQGNVVLFAEESGCAAPGCKKESGPPPWRGFF
jgi:hypothetical protein